MSETTTAVAVRETPIATLQDVEKVGGWMAESGMFGCKNKAQAMVLAVTCQMEKITPIEFGRKYHLIDGKPTMRSDAILAAFHNLGGTEKWIRVDDVAAVAQWSYGANTGLELKFSMEDAKRAGIVRPGSGWTKYPDAMLRARLIAKAVRMLCPEAITGGGYSAEEAEDMRGGEMPASGPAMAAVPSEAPKTLAPEEVAVSPAPGAEPKAEDPAPEVAPSEIDYDIIPVGKRKGEKLSDQQTKYLQAFITGAHKYPEIKPGHCDRAEALLMVKELQS